MWLTNMSPRASDFGVGLRIVGGVNCEQCRNLHAVITSVLPGTECAQTVRQGKRRVRRREEGWGDARYMCNLVQ